MNGETFDFWPDLWRHQVNIISFPSTYFFRAIECRLNFVNLPSSSGDTRGAKNSPPPEIGPRSRYNQTPPGRGLIFGPHVDSVVRCANLALGTYLRSLQSSRVARGKPFRPAPLITAFNWYICISASMTWCNIVQRGPGPYVDFSFFGPYRSTSGPLGP